ncbi:NAD(P)/FAD-dependent oxidoreductase [Desulfotomaculum copahuensis]|uniref:FAD-dependent protein C-terminal domain-containing protein n=1 Tax=Desulfotomaculum copahuensis TaxID=1838280 RepID=A0A1B7LKV8_9FIRM|nr:hypothetical protein [Desulfotomaculum copahuensis]OAT87141.1 hypothetical protein A6M21_01895 [Desulfotomaculum copahuensis]
MLRVQGIKLPIDHDQAQLKKALLIKLGLKEKDLLGYAVHRRSIDARDKERIFFVYTVDAEVKNEDKATGRHNRDVSPAVSPVYHYVPAGNRRMSHRPLIAGTGPAGLFAGLLLARMGYRPVLLERGADVDTRTGLVKEFWATGNLNPECNVQFGEGGAGTFSDGKLTTLIKDKRCRKVLEELVCAGAPEEILYVHKPHVGTDILKEVIKNLRRSIIAAGGEVRFNSKLTDIVTEGNSLSGVVINGTAQLPAEILVLATGHSARDTFAMLHARGLAIVPKAFSIGLRVEHPQSLIDAAQYGKFAGHPALGPAEYKLVHHASTGRPAYTFCMCPGGTVIAAASEPGGVVTNGMSEHARNAPNANSALLVGVTPDDFGSGHPLAGVEFQRLWEQKAFVLGGGEFRAPAQLVGDFLADRPSTGFGSVIPSYPRLVTPADLKGCLPPYVIATLREAIPAFDRKLHGFARSDAVLTGVETRSSSPIRMLRDENCGAGIKGVYPAGEGAGYAGGIVSAAVDGIRVAEAIAARYKPWE